MLTTFVGDVRLAARMLRRSPVFTIVAVLCVSIGSGAVTTIFSAMNAVLLRPLPGAADGARLIAIDRRTPDSSEGVSASFEYYDHLRRQSRTLAGIAAWSKVDLSIAIDGAGSAVYGNIVSGNYFAVLGVRPALGRFFAPEEGQTPLADPVVVISHQFWRSRLGADPGAVGRAVSVNGHPFTIVGVAPAGFRGVFTPIETDGWVLLSMQAQLRPGRDLSGAPWLQLFGRLSDGVSRESARQELDNLTAAHIAAATEPASFATYRSVRLFGLTGLPEDASRAIGGFIAALLAAATLVLLIASVNVASMLSARAVARRREMAVRAALGAGRARLVAQLLTESLVLFLLGACGGAVLAFAGTRALERTPIPSDVPLSMELSPDLRVLAFALVVSLIAGVIFGLAPALQAARTDMTTRLRADSAGTGARGSLMSRSLIVGQVALSLLLLVSAGLFLRALERGHRVPPGFELAGVATASLNAESWGYDDARGRAFYRRLRERVAASPDVIAVSYAGVLPLTWGGSGGTIQTEKGSVPAAQLSIGLVSVDADYFTVLQLPLLQGRGLDSSDDERAARVAVINATLARRLSPEGDALGRTFGFHGERVTVVGIAADAKYSHLGEDTPAFAYFPLAQFWQPNQTLLIRTAGDPSRLGPRIHDAMRSIDPALPGPKVITLRDAASIVLLPQRVAAIVTGALGGVGLLLAAVGLYGIIAYSTSRRTREIGVRMALGARRSDVVRLIVHDGMRLVGVGIAIGLSLAFAATRLIAGLLFGVSPLDSVTFVVMSILFAAVAFIASYLPARRAAAASPMTALRSE
jgi:predicted permease